MKYPRETIAQVLSAVDIVDIIGARISLKPSGTDRYKALSPFTNEKTPSFMVSRDRQTFHCFSSGRGGDAIAFLMEFEGLTFSEALRKLADGAGIRLGNPTEQDDREEYLRAQLLELGKFTADFYRRALLDGHLGAPGRAYLERRALRPETVARFGLGYAQDQWTGLYDAAVRRQFKENVLEASGLFRRGERGDRGMYDFFRHRLIFPIKDVSGNVVAFGGRDLGDSPAKYINSPETQVYKKGRVLYGLHESRDAMRREKSAILVEGYFDLLRCFDSGVENVVATCGTALTEQQAALIRRYVPEVVLVFDGDAAGVKAALRGSGILTAAGLRVRALTLPDNKDPDDYVRDAGVDAFRGLLRDAPDFVSFYVAMSHERTGTVEGRTEIARELFQMVRHVDDRLRAEEYLKIIARALGIQEWSCKREFERAQKEEHERPAAVTQTAAATAQAAPAAPHRDELEFLAALASGTALRARVAEELDGLELPETPLAAVLALLLDPSRSDLTLIAHDLEDPAARTLWCAAAAQDAPEPERAADLATRITNTLKRRILKDEAARLQEEIRRAARDQDSPALNDLLRKCNVVRERLDKIPAA
ncbi:MAG: DNA primase [Candidatus Hydrogenedens sp.]|nr:DNA primase [Candidatus Hydrogenedentota bacterium]NLF58770.1 DNA primase [Candidatus Hydrogenedens sp.]